MCCIVFTAPSPALPPVHRSALFFVVYILGGIFFLVQLLLAIVLDDMASNLEVSVKRSIVRTRIAYEKAYDLLVPDDVNGISASSWQLLVKYLRPGWVKSGVAEMLFAYVDSFDEEAQSHDITLEEFRHAMLYFKYEIKVSKKQYKELHSAYIQEVQAMLQSTAAAAEADQKLQAVLEVPQGSETPAPVEASPSEQEHGKKPVKTVTTSDMTRAPSLAAISLEHLSSGATSNPLAGAKPAVTHTTTGAATGRVTSTVSETSRSSSSASLHSGPSQTGAHKVRPQDCAVTETGTEVQASEAKPASAAPHEHTESGLSVSEAAAAPIVPSPRPGSSASARPGSAGRTPAAPVAPGAAAMRLPNSSINLGGSTPRRVETAGASQGDGDDLFEEDPVLCGVCADRGCCARCCHLPASVRDTFRTRFVAFSDWLQRILGLRWGAWAIAEMVFNLFVALNLGCVIATIVLEADGRPPTDSVMRTLVVFQYLFLLLFVLEVSLKLTAFGIEEFWRRSVSNQMDLVLLVASIIAESVLLINSSTGVIDSAVSSSNTAAVVSVSRVFRLLRLLRALRAFRKVFTTIGQMVPVLTGVFSVLILMFYSFAMVGIDIWGGQIDKQDLETNHPDNLYVTAAYWGLNFDSLPRAMLCCLTFVVVNNFFVLLDGLSATTSLSIAWAYFAIFYVAVVLIAVNVLVAIIFQAFVFKYRHDDGLVLSGAEQQQFIKVAADGTPYRTRDEMKLSALDSATLIMARDLEWFIFERFQRKARVQQKLTLRHLELETTAATMEATGIDEGSDSDGDAEWADEEYNTMLQASKHNDPRRKSLLASLGFSWGGSSKSALGDGSTAQRHESGRAASTGPIMSSPVLGRRSSHSSSHRRQSSFLSHVVGEDIDPYRRNEIADNIVQALRGGTNLQRQEAVHGTATISRPARASSTAEQSNAAASISRRAQSSEAPASGPHGSHTMQPSSNNPSRSTRNFKQRLQAYRAQRMLAADIADSLARGASTGSEHGAAGDSAAAIHMLPIEATGGSSDTSLHRMGAAIAAARLLGRRASALQRRGISGELLKPTQPGAGATGGSTASVHGSASGVQPGSTGLRARRRWSSLREGVQSGGDGGVRGGSGPSAGASPWSATLAALASKQYGKGGV